MELRRQFEAERRKSMSVEEAILRLQRDNKEKEREVSKLKEEVADNKAEIDDLTDKAHKAGEIIEALNDQNDNLRNQIDHIHNATINIANYSEEIHALKRKISDIERDISHVENQISSAQSELARLNREGEEKKKRVRELAAEGNLEPQLHAPPSQYFGRKDSGSLHSESTEEEKNHVIKVLEHESKLYHFEKHFLKMMNQNQAPPLLSSTPAPYKPSNHLYEMRAPY